MGKLIFLLILSLFFLTFACSEQKSVAILSSYDPEDVCGKPQLEGVLDALKNNLKDVKIDITYLDSRRVSSEELSKRCDAFNSKVKTLQPSLIIVNDDAAFQCVAKHFMGGKIPVIFSGINVSPDKYNEKFNFLKGRKPIKNFTGIYEKIFVKKQFEFLEILGYKVEKIAVLYSNDMIGEILKEQVIYETKGTAFEKKIVFYPVKNISEIENAAKEINHRSDITAYFPFLMSIKDEKIYTLRDLKSLLLEKIKKPDISINERFAEEGFLGGVSVDFYYMGYRAGEMASYLLKGVTNFPNLEVEESDIFIKTINLKRAKSLSIKVSEENLLLFDRVIR